MMTANTIPDAAQSAKELSILTLFAVGFRNSVPLLAAPAFVDGEFLAPKVRDCGCSMKATGSTLKMNSSRAPVTKAEARWAGR